MKQLIFKIQKNNLCIQFKHKNMIIACKDKLSTFTLNSDMKVFDLLDQYQNYSFNFDNKVYLINQFFGEFEDHRCKKIITNNNATFFK